MKPQDILQKFGPRESMDYDVVVVGGGPAGLATAIRVKQLKPDASVVVLEKGSEPGAHILSGAVMARARSPSCCRTGSSSGRRCTSR